MRRLLRKLRGMAGVGMTWALGWSLVLGVVWAIIGIVDPASIDRGEEFYRVGPIIATVGFFCGTIFAAIFALAENRKSIRDLSLWRTAVWGVIGGAALPLLTGINDAVIVNTVPLAALFSVGTVAMARRAARRESLQERHPDALPDDAPVLSLSPQ